MKISTLLLAFATTLVTADILPRQDATPTPPSLPTPTPLSLSPQATCLAACDPTDVNCRAACVGVAHPNSVQVVQTNECAGRCRQGNGTVPENDAYSACVQGCINSYYPMGQSMPPTPLPLPTETPTGTGVGAETTGIERPESTPTPGGNASNAPSRPATSRPATTRESASASGSATPTSTPNAASGPLLSSAGGLVGLFVAFFAL